MTPTSNICPLLKAFVEKSCVIEWPSLLVVNCTLTEVRELTGCTFLNLTILSSLLRSFSLVKPKKCSFINHLPGTLFSNKPRFPSAISSSRQCGSVLEAVLHFLFTSCIMVLEFYFLLSFVVLPVHLTLPVFVPFPSTLSSPTLITHTSVFSIFPWVHSFPLFLPVLHDTHYFLCFLISFGLWHLGLWTLPLPILDLFTSVWNDIWFWPHLPLHRVSLCFEMSINIFELSLLWLPVSL